MLEIPFFYACINGMSPIINAHEDKFCEIEGVKDYNKSALALDALFIVY